MIFCKPVFIFNELN